MSDHTATPWYATVEDWGDGPIYSLRDSDGTEIGSIWSKAIASNDPLPGAANAELIVRACNAHDELVEALAALTLWCEPHGLSTTSGVAFAAHIAHAKQALAKARGES